MKLTSILLFISSLCFSQTFPKTEYAYSGSGNRILRKINISPFRIASKDSVSSAEEFPKILMQEGISVYPNPTKELVYVSINDYDDTQKNNLTLIDAKGTEILFQNITTQKTEFNISQIKSGVYYFKVVKNKTVLYYKLVKIE